MMRLPPSIIPVASLVFATLCLAAEPSSPANLPQSVARFIDEQTIIVGHLSPGRVDLDGLQAILVDLARTMEQEEPAIDEIEAAKTAASTWLDQFKKAGGTDLYMFYSIVDLPEEEDPFLVAPLGSAADARALAGLLCSGQPDGPTTLPAGHEGTRPPDRVAERLGTAIVAGPGEVVERLRSLRPVARPEIERALQAAGDAPARIVFVPTADSRRIVEEMIPSLPPVLGGGPVTALTRGALWAAMSLHTRPAAAVRVIVQSQDAASARALFDVIDKALQTAAQEKELRENITGFEELLTLLKPTVRNDQLVLELNAESVWDVVGKVLAPPLGRAHAAAKRTASAKVLLNIGTALFRYGAKNKDRWPPDLPTLVKEGYLKEEMLVNPSRPLQKTGYVYIRPSQTMSQVDPRRMLMYEAFDNWGEGINVSFADAHVEFIAEEARFKELLKEATAKGTVTNPPATQPAAAGGHKQVMNDLRQIALACLLYTQRHKGEWPKDLTSLVDAKLLPGETLVHPTRTGDEIGYTYIRPTEADPKKPTQLIIAYESRPDWKNGVAVAFADGHVELIRTQARFDELLARAKGEKPGGK